MLGFVEEFRYSKYFRDGIACPLAGWLVANRVQRNNRTQINSACRRECEAL
jgi:hypothetical protein